MSVVAVFRSASVSKLKYYGFIAFALFLAICMLILLSPFVVFGFFAHISASLFDFGEMLFDVFDTRMEDLHEKLSKTSK